MFDFMRDRATAEDKRQELLDAYLDNALAPDEQARFDTQLAGDARLRADVERLRALRLQLRAMPHRRVPRSFALNPAVYGRPKPQPLLQLYPALRGATALSAFLLIFVLALGAFRGQFAPAGIESPVVGEVAISETADTAADPFEQAAPVEEEAAEAQAAASAENATALEMAAAPTEAAAELVPPEGTTVPAPGGDLTLESMTGSPTVELFAEEDEAARITAEPTAETVAEAMATAAPESLTPPVDQARSLLPLQIGLALAFLAFLVLWLMARQRARRF